VINRVKKYYVITERNKKVYFGQASASDFTHHKDEQRRQLYVNRHKNNEIWSKSGIASAGFGLVGCYGINQQ
jgi:hypothetical protein